MKNKSTEELKQERQIIIFLIDYYYENKKKTMNPKEFEDYVNAALEILLEIRKELERRGETF